MRQRPRETDQLLLAGGESVAAFPHRLAKPLGQRLDEIQQVHAFRGFRHLLIADAFGAQPDIAPDVPVNRYGSCSTTPK